ncbi:hypothetical protein Dimus_017266 [Dionaea muscipula]
MSWLVTSIANSLKLDDDDDTNGDSASASLTNAGDNRLSPAAQSQPHNPQIGISIPPSASDGAAGTTPRRGVKEDITELSKTLSRQFWGVASFLAPPPPQISDRDPDSNPPPEKNNETGVDSAESLGISGIRSDLSEIGGRFRTGIAKLSSNKAVSELTKIASNFLQQLGEDDDELMEEQAQHGVVGVTEQVVAFARDISLHPETWLEFPLPDDDEGEDFDMSDVQQEHALAVERFAPRLAALRIELCPGYMSEGSFWKIYFVLVHPRLSKEDALLLSTPQIMEARAMLTQELQKCAKSRPDNSRVGANLVEETTYVPPSDQAEIVPIELSASDSANSSHLEMDKHPVISAEIPIIDKAVVEEGPISKSSSESSTSSTLVKGLDQLYHEDDGDAWLKEENPEIVDVGNTIVPITNDDDVSFSDLEDDDDDNDDDIPSSYKRVVAKADASDKDSRDWVTLNSKSADSGRKGINTVKIDRASDQANEDKEISGWLDLDDIDSN